MKNIKRYLAFALTLVMAVTFALPMAFGATITVGNAIKGQTYTAYKVFEVSKNTDKSAVAYYLTAAQYDAYGSDLVAAGVEFDNVSSDGSYYVDTEYTKTLDGDGAKDLATAINGFKNKLTVAGSGVGATNEETSNTGSATISVDDAGYYFVDSSLGAVCALLDADADFDMIEKNDEPTVTKTADDGAQAVSHSIGDVVPFEIKVYPGGNADTSYIVTDTMTAGLDLVADSIQITPPAANAAAEQTTNDHGFTITFPANYTANLGKDDVVTINYNAKINANAVVASLDANKNDVKLQYGDTYTVDTDKTTVSVYNGSVEVTKYGNNDETNLLNGAQFVILNADGTQYLKNNWATNTYNDGSEDWAKVPASWATIPSDAMVLTTTNGKASLSGIATGTYQLLEVVAPEGYNKLEEAQDFVIDGATVTSLTATAKINNNSGATMPSTGGIGTTIFYIVGGVMVAGAVIFLLTKRRASAAE